MNAAHWADSKHAAVSSQGPVATNMWQGRWVAYTNMSFREAADLDWRIGGRYFSSFEHTYLPPRSSYDRIDFERNVSGKANTLTWESELDLSMQLGPGRIFLRGSLSYVTGVPDGKYVFEETLHVIVEPPWVWRSRIGYSYVFGSHGQHSVGPAVDFLDVPGREDSTTVRVVWSIQ